MLKNCIFTPSPFPDLLLREKTKRNYGLKEQGDCRREVTQESVEEQTRSLLRDMCWQRKSTQGALRGVRGRWEGLKGMKESPAGVPAAVPYVQEAAKRARSCHVQYPAPLLPPAPVQCPLTCRELVHGRGQLVPHHAPGCCTHTDEFEVDAQKNPGAAAMGRQLRLSAS